MRQTTGMNVHINTLTDIHATIVKHVQTQIRREELEKTLKNFIFYLFPFRFFEQESGHQKKYSTNTHNKVHSSEEVK